MMKKLLIVILFLGFYTQADMHKSNHFVSVDIGSSMPLLKGL